MPTFIRERFLHISGVGNPKSAVSMHFAMFK
jgi:hypothetical protein